MQYCDARSRTSVKEVLLQLLHLLAEQRSGATTERN